MAGQRQARRMITVEPIGPVTKTMDPIPVVAMLRWAPPFDGRPEPRPMLAVAWTQAQVLVRRSWPETSTEAWLPARDVHRIHELARPTPAVARVPAAGGGIATVEGQAVAYAIHRGGRHAFAVRVRLAPGTEQEQERWVLPEDLVDADPLDDVAS